LCKKRYSISCDEKVQTSYLYTHFSSFDYEKTPAEASVSVEETVWFLRYDKYDESRKWNMKKAKPVELFPGHNRLCFLCVG